MSTLEQFAAKYGFSVKTRSLSGEAIDPRIEGSHGDIWESENDPDGKLTCVYNDGTFECDEAYDFDPSDGAACLEALS